VYRINLVLGRATDQANEDLYAQGTLEDQTLFDRGQRRIVKGGGRNVIKTKHRAVLRNPHASAGEGTDRPESGYVIKGHQRGEVPPPRQELMGEFIALRVAGIAPLDLHNKLGIEFQPDPRGQHADATPSLLRVNQRFGTLNERYFPMSQRVQMFEGTAGPRFIVRGDRTSWRRELSAHRDRGNTSFRESLQRVGPQKEQIRHRYRNEPIDSPFQERLNGMIEPPLIILGIGQDRHVAMTIEGVFYALENLRAIRIRNVENQDPEGPTPLAPQ